MLASRAKMSATAWQHHQPFWDTSYWLLRLGSKRIDDIVQIFKLKITYMCNFIDYLSKLYFHCDSFERKKDCSLC